MTLFFVEPFWSFVEPSTLGLWATTALAAAVVEERPAGTGRAVRYSFSGNAVAGASPAVATVPGAVGVLHREP